MNNHNKSIKKHKHSTNLNPLIGDDATYGLCRVQYILQFIQSYLYSERLDAKVILKHPEMEGLNQIMECVIQTVKYENERADIAELNNYKPD